MTTKIRIDLSQGIVEAEGSEDFVQMIYDDFKDKISYKSPPEAPKDNLPKEIPERKPPRTKPPKKKQKYKQSGQRMQKVVNNLDLSGKGVKKSLRDFYAGFSPSSNMERNLIFVYYLNNTMKVSPITIDHVFTCYCNIKSLKIPVSLEQSLKDTRALKNWLDTSSLDDLKLTIHGTNHIEHDIKRAGDSTDA